MPVSYDLGLVLLSYLVASFAAFTMLDLAARVSKSGRSSLGWLCGGAVAMGLGIWAMHFVGMLALHLGIELSFDLATTLGSMLPAIGASALGLSFLRRPRTSVEERAVAALAMGMGIATMHYAGMSALAMAPAYGYDWLMVALSVLIAIVASFVALTVALHLRHTSLQEALGRRVGAALLMGVAVAGMHYTGMAATRFAPGSVCMTPRTGLSGGWLALLVGLAASSLMLLTLVASIIDTHRLRLQRRRDAARLARANRKAEFSAAQTQAILEAALDCIITMDGEGRIVHFNGAAEAAFGMRRADVIGRPLADCIVPPALREQHQRGMEALLAGDATELLGQRIETVGWRSDGSEFPLELSLTATPVEGRPGFTAHLRDIGERRRAEQALRLHSLALASVATGICIVDRRSPGQPIAYVNPAFEAMSGYAAAELTGQSVEALAHRADGQPLAELLEAAQAGQARRHGYLRRDGRQIWCDLFATPLYGADGELGHSVIVASDSTSTVGHEQRLQQLANYDALTGLPNRLQLREQLARRIEREAERGPFMLLFIDLDHFKVINDSLGHDTGDVLLKTVAERLAGCVRSDDVVARLGGDEFVVLLETQGRGEVLLDALLARVRERVGEPVSLQGRQLHVTCSIGVSRFPEDGRDAETLLRKADAAMYQAKREGRNEARAFTGELERTIRERLDLETELRDSLARGAFELHYQPLVRIDDGSLFGAEALLRWRHPELGLVMPDRFIGVAEETGLIVPLGDWVLDRACRQSLHWRGIDGRPLQIAVNVSPRQLNEADFGERVAEVLLTTGFPPERLELEITESLFTDGNAASAANLRQLAGLGVRLAIDDFGTGYSNLGKLKSFAVSRLKIDRSFVALVDQEGADAAIATAIIALGRGLALEVIGEGVETEAQRRWLADAGCAQAQGWLFGRAEPAERFEERLAAYAPGGVVLSPS
ncbi:EAL domain-containing protein [Pelomonas sp. KK5]|uniref:bifunctional diguanylate cyclase/phosphodiesterase n=1 Tax=Pelomonas sp. KK5 TaxID=1855730 RepID=UPI00097BAF9E|nr:EAL domain-containing protein [Pelomonas sp. KK5]